MRLPPALLTKGINHVRQLEPLARKLGVPLRVLALKFVLAHETVSTVIPGIRRAEQAQQNAAACKGPDLTREDLAWFRRLFEERFDTFLNELRAAG